MTTPGTKSDFMAAEDIKAILAGREKIEQERIMRWVGESLGVTAAPAPAAAPSAKPADPAAPAAPAGAPAAPLGHKNDIKSFMSAKMPKSDMQAAAVIAYFYRFEAPEAERKDTVTPNDLQTASRQARGYSFNNARVTLNNAVGQGYFDRGGARGVFSLNAVGENLVAMALPGSGGDNGGKASRKPARSKAQSAKKAKKA